VSQQWGALVSDASQQSASNRVSCSSSSRSGPFEGPAKAPGYAGGFVTSQTDVGSQPCHPLGRRRNRTSPAPAQTLVAVSLLPHGLVVRRSPGCDSDRDRPYAWCIGRSFWQWRRPPSRSCSWVVLWSSSSNDGRYAGSEATRGLTNEWSRRTWRLDRARLIRHVRPQLEALGQLERLRSH
jgi:hypothetical protein